MHGEGQVIGVKDTVAFMGGSVRCVNLHGKVVSGRSGVLTCVIKWVAMCGMQSL